VKAARIHRWGGDLLLEDVPEPDLRDGEVLVEIAACGVGLTVLNYLRGDLGNDTNDLPRVPGHELVGRIVAVGPGVTPEREGELVAAFFYLFCGRCRHCLAGEEDLCQKLAGFLGVNRDGGYAERVSLPARNAIRLPENIDPVLATVVNDAVATPVHVANLAGFAPGQRVAVVAAGGGVGVHMVQVAQLFGAEVAGLDVTAEKLAYLEAELGVVPIESSNFANVTLPAAWDGKADVVVDLLGRPESLRWSLGVLAGRGRLVILTTFRDVDLPISPRDLVLSQLAILGSRYCTRAEFELAARLVAGGRVRPVIGRRERIAKVHEIHEDLRAGRLLGRGALVWQ
jgi:propanol-preferring alcohol dehydrogenase